MSLEFNQTSQSLPKEGIWCETMDELGRISRMRRHGDLWYYTNGLGTHYVPNLWRYLRYDDDH